LAQNKFSVYEDGKAQTISDFRRVDLDRSQPTAPRGTWSMVAEDISDNTTPFDGRFYVLVLDDLHVDPGHSGEVRRMASHFIDHYLSCAEPAYSSVQPSTFATRMWASPSTA
jgi:hypothetical protein